MKLNKIEHHELAKLSYRPTHLFIMKGLFFVGKKIVGYRHRLPEEVLTKLYFYRNLIVANCLPQVIYRT
jgi:hypothetical protein